MKKVLDNKVALVTGSGQGVGKEIALCMARHGAKIITNNRKPGSSINSMEKTALDYTEEERKKLEAIVGDAQTCADEIIRNGGEAVPFFGDVSDPEKAKAMVQAAIDNYGRVDIIVNNAASFWTGNISNMSIDMWNVNVLSKLSGSFYMMHFALPYMKEQKFGRILNASSDAFLGLMGLAAYSSASAGIVALSKAAAQDLAEYGITVNSFTPLAKTRAWYNMLTTYRLQGVPSEAIEEAAPAAMQNTADIMVPFLAYLASDQAQNISGINFKIAADGLIGVWSDPQVFQSIQKDDGAWTIEELEKRIPEELMKGISTVKATIDLH